MESLPPPTLPKTVSQELLDSGSLEYTYPPPKGRLSSQVKSRLGREDLGMSTGEGACGCGPRVMAGVWGVCLCL